MSSPTLVEADPLPVDRPSGTSHKGPRPFWAGATSGLLLWASFPPADWGWLAWGALVPLFLLVLSDRPAWSIYLGAWTGGLVFWVPAIQWLRLTDASAWLGWLVMALVLSLFWPAFLFLSRWSCRKHRLPLMVGAPVAWIALEYVRAHIFSGFPWYYLAHSQHAFLPVIQVSDLTGSLGVSLALAVVNAWLVDLISLPLARPTPGGVRLTPGQGLRLAVVGSMLGGMLGYGAYRLGTARFHDGPRIALLQSNLPQRLKMGGDSSAIVLKYRALIERALRAPIKPEIILWPETSLPYSFATFAKGVTPEELDRQVQRFAPTLDGQGWRERAERVTSLLRNWADGTGVPMLVGAISYDHQPTGYQRYNSALLVRPGETRVERADKLHLVPFGEYVPMIGIFPWLAALTPYDSDHVPSLAFGANPVWFDIGPFRFASAICFEDTVPHVYRRLIAEAPDHRRPDVILNLSNDGWFVDEWTDGSRHRSSEHEMHLAVSVFRAIEHRTPLARAANTGVSAIVDGNGRILQQRGTLEEGVVQGVVPLDHRRAFYTEWGDWLGKTCLAVTIGLIPLGVVRRKHPRRRPRV